jgi:hypothetical protein
LLNIITGIKVFLKILVEIFKMYSKIVSRFLKFSDKFFFNHELNFYNRVAFINSVLNKFDLDKCKYLEVGVDNNFVFNSIPLKMENKIGVDPQKGGTHRMTSDNFFQNNKKLFDVIFIDGDHSYKQARKDFLNSVNCLNKNGIIIIHDVLPRSYYEQKVPQMIDIWKGDVWKLIAEIYDSQSKKKIIIANIDCGIAFIKIYKGFQLKKSKKYQKLDFYKDFLGKYFKILPIKNSQQCLEEIINF